MYVMPIYSKATIFVCLEVKLIFHMAMLYCSIFLGIHQLQL